MEDNIEYEKWRNLIGDYMLTFAKIEGELNHLLSDLCSDSEFEMILTKKFKCRQNKAKELLNSKIADKKLINSGNNILDKLLNFAEKERNLIAHNPLEISLESIFQDSSYLEIRSQRKSEKYITYQKLSEKYILLTKSLKDFENFNDCIISYLIAKI